MPTLPPRAAGLWSIDDMLSLEEISDRLEIIDAKQFDDLDNVFTKDAYIDQ